MTEKGPDGKDQASIKPVKEGSDIQSTFSASCGARSILTLTLRMFPEIW